jgi:hypothetical protein
MARNLGRTRQNGTMTISHDEAYAIATGNRLLAADMFGRLTEDQPGVFTAVDDHGFRSAVARWKVLLTWGDAGCDVRVGCEEGAPFGCGC